MQFTNFTWALLLAAATTLVSAQTSQVNGTAIHFNGDRTMVVSLNTNPHTGSGNGVAVQLRAAIPDGQQGEGAQRWIINRGPTKVKLGVSTGIEYCLDAGATPTNGTQMKLWQCYDNLPAQAWYYTGDNRIALENQGFCLDLPNGNVAAGQTLQIWACATGNTNQIWTL
ncbi:hypothetical protein D9611_007087 [Ephemerocybe angulata]|uniref:Ricin B lectin domain-containing protein n=1 Tax=Ephemerocybe angulata TaxID=980116 RepID=A0A8H5EWK0_9AGAR|nr:hypothetical protein D9611_007087 [Tulosesus angulatus]